MSSFPPRECGIATFTEDLITAFDKEFNSNTKSKVLAINYNGTSIYNYPRKVVMQINETEIEDYLNRANEINNSPEIKLVNIQHEYGLFGGDWGDYLLAFLELLQKPVVLTMHTVLPRPDEKLRSLTKTITEKAYAVAVMTKTSAKMLANVYGVQKKKIRVIPHGVHHIAFPSKGRAKKKLNLSGRTVLSTFGMLNRDKGIEYAIEALPEIVKEHPDVLYLIIGATHPVVRREEGEVYRNKLKRTITKLGLEENVKFYDKYLDLGELIDFLKATDIYISPTLNPRQAVSGTISYALSCACPIVATRNQYARDVINNDRGRLVKFKNALDIEKALAEILSDKKLRKEMGKNSYFYSRHMTWQNVALSYYKVFNEVAKMRPRVEGKLPSINVGYIKTLSTDFSIIQFANHTRPDIYSGYCLDDNARAMLGFAEYYDIKKVNGTLKMVERYLKFTKYVQKKNGKFHNFVNYNKEFNDHAESEDSFGRSIWSLGCIIKSKNLPLEIKEEARRIFKKAQEWVDELKSLRSISFTIIGLSHIAQNTEDNDNIKAAIVRLSDKMIEKYNENANNKENGEEWNWFENCFTYSNYKLPEAMFLAYQATKDKRYLEIAEKSLKFIMKITFEKKEYFSPIGQDGWYFRNGKRAYFDQQPEDAASAVEALVTAHLITGKKDYKEKAYLTFQWFLGKNHLNQMVYDEATGGCYDGLGKYSLNFNQGAESTLSYFLARLAIGKIYK